MNLVVHHVLETLVVGGAKENLNANLAASVTAVKHLQNMSNVVGHLKNVNGSPAQVPIRDHSTP